MSKVAMPKRGPGMEWLGGKLFGNYIYSHHNVWRPPSIKDTKVGNKPTCGLYVHEKELEEF